MNMNIVGPFMQQVVMITSEQPFLMLRLQTGGNDG